MIESGFLRCFSPCRLICKIWKCLKSCLCVIFMYLNITNGTDGSNSKQRQRKNMPAAQENKNEKNTRGRKKHKSKKGKRQDMGKIQTTLTDWCHKKGKKRSVCKKTDTNDSPIHKDKSLSASPVRKLEDASSSRLKEVPSSSRSSDFGRDKQPKRQRPNEDEKAFHHDVSDSESDSSEETQPYTFQTEQHASVHRVREGPSTSQRQVSSFTPSPWSARDTEAYRKGYPGKRDNPSMNDNWKFYNNEMESRPRGAFIDVIHKEWYYSYNLLEDHHGYIQWLFPIREQGMNWQSKELQLHEAKKICGDPKAKERVLKSYEMMLNFWGMRLADKQTGEITREKNWQERFRNLNRSSHNYLRITRMLKSLGELGNERLKLPFLKFVLDEAIEKRTLENATRSCLNYWIHTLRDDDKRNDIQEHANWLLARS